MIWPIRPWRRYTTELKPCPFCSNKPDLRESFGRLVVECFTRGCVKPSTWISGPVTTDLRVIADFWNRRMPDDMRDKIEEKFNEAVDVMTEDKEALTNITR